MFRWIKEIAYQNARSEPKPNHRHRRPSRGPNYFRPRLEVLEDRLAPAAVNMYWDPTSGANASTTANWDVGSLGSGMHPANAPGNTAGETDNVYFDGTAGQGGNKSCTWDYTPTNAVHELLFTEGWTQTLAFLDKQGLSVSGTAGVSPGAAPTLTPNGSSGTNAVAAITLKNGTVFTVSGGSTLFLTGYSTGNAIFFAGDGTAGDYLSNGGTVSYTGHSSGNDYLKIPVLNGWSGVFNVNGGGTSRSGSTLQVSGTDTNTNNVSFYQNSSQAQTNISGKGTLWGYNNYTMTAGSLNTKDAYLEKLMVGTSGNSPVDGTVTLTGGVVNMNVGTNGYGKLQILGTTQSNVPILNIGNAVLNFKVNMTLGSNQCDQLFVGKTTGTGKVNFGYDGTTTLVDLNPQGNETTGHQWPVIYYGAVTGTSKVSVDASVTVKWNPNDLELDN